MFNIDSCRRHYHKSTLSGVYAFKHTCAVVDKENAYIETVDLTGLFLYAKRDNHNERLLLKIRGAVELLLVEPDGN